MFEASVSLVCSVFGYARDQRLVDFYVRDQLYVRLTFMFGTSCMFETSVSRVSLMLV